MRWSRSMPVFHSERPSDASGIEPDSRTVTVTHGRRVTVYNPRMVRPESSVEPAGESPAQVSAGTPGSRPQSLAERPVSERGVESLR
jgi:hypothetical protein